MAWLNKYPDGGKVSSKVGDPPTKKVKINPLLDFRNDPFRPKGLGVQAQDNLRPLPIMDKVKADKEIQNRIALDKIKSQPQLNPTREQSIPQQKINLAKKQAYANSQPNAKLVNGQLEEINPGYTMEGQPFGPNEKRFDKGLNHIATGLEVAGYLTGAGELYRGLRGIKTAANAVEDVFWNGKSYQKTPLSNPTIVSQSQGIDALPAGYNANLGNQSPYVAATTDEALMTTQGRVDWNGVNSDNISNWFNTRANKSEIDWAKWNSEIPTNKALMSEYNTIEQTSKAKGTWMKNPDGSAFQGSPEQFIQQNSENFKKAFGKSKVLDKNGNVQIAKHTTGKKFDEFDMSKFGSSTDEGFYGKGMYFHPKSNEFGVYGDNEIQAYLNIQKPASKDVIPFFGRTGRGKKALNTEYHNNEDLWKGKYDGVIADPKTLERNYMDFNDTEYVTNIPSNIKSAIGNNGMFDMTNPNIYKALVPAVAGVGVLKQKKNGGTIKNWLNKY